MKSCKSKSAAWVLGLALVCSPTLTVPAASPTNAVAVLDFKLENPAAFSNERMAGLEDFFEVTLEKQDVPVLERRSIRLILAERNLQAGGLSSAESLSQAKLPVVDYFVSGSVAFSTASEFTLTLSIFRADKAALESSLTRHGNYPDHWLPAIKSLATEVNTRLHLPKRDRTERSEFEEMTWLPEAVLPFFRGLDDCGENDYAAAVPWFRESYSKDRHFNIARRWEARAYRKLNLPQLAKALAAYETNAPAQTDLKRPVVAVLTGKNLSAAGRAAFLQVLAQSGQFEIFDPASIDATAREIDLQLTGQMVAPLNDRSVWLVVDDLIYLDAPDAETLVVREQKLLSGEVVRQVKIQGNHADEAGCAALARAFLQNKNSSPTVSPGNENREALPEPGRFESFETALPKALRLVQAEPDNARYWIGLADYYGDNQFKAVCLDEAINAIGRKRNEPDAAYWLASALWRKREMASRIFYEPTAIWHASSPLTNDFNRLLQWFPKSAEAASLVEVTNHGEGSYRRVEPADRRYLAAIYTNLNNVSPLPNTSGKTVAASTVTDAQRFALLDACLRDGRNAPAWQLANDLNRTSNSSNNLQVQTALTNLSQTCLHESQQFEDFSSAVVAGDETQIWELGQELSKCIDRRHRSEVINRCVEIIKKQKGANEQLKYLFVQARRYREDFLVNPLTGEPGNHFEYQWMENFNTGMPVITPDYGYEPLMGKVAEIAHDQPPSDLTREILDFIRNDPLLPREKQLTAACDLALWEQAKGDDFEALDRLKDILRQTEGTGLPLRRNNTWSQSIEGAAFDALRKIRIYSGAATDVCDCCGKVQDEPPQKPSNYDEVNRELAQLWKQQVGEAGISNPPIKQQLLADKDNFFPVILYKLRAGDEVSHTLIFCADLGTNALPALPVILQIVRRGEPFQDYNNALNALGALGRAAGCAKPLLILARENGDNGNYNYAFKSIGPAPRPLMPQLASLLYHKDPEISRQAAKAMIETAPLERTQFQNMSDEQKAETVRKWWEQVGELQRWGE